MIWVFNIVLYWAYLNSPVVYDSMIAQGATCWQHVSTSNLPTFGLGYAMDDPPPCFYTEPARARAYWGGK